MSLTTFVREQMLLARETSKESTCQRRKIGVVISNAGTYVTGSNGPLHVCNCCNRELGDCPAIHAEQDAISKLPRWTAGTLFIWAEVPCVQCLNFIAATTDIENIHCLTSKSYVVEYPRVKTYSLSLQNRLALANKLNLTIHQHDRDEILGG